MHTSNHVLYDTKLQVKLALLGHGELNFISCRLEDGGTTTLAFLPNNGVTLPEQINTLRRIAHQILEQLEEIDAKSV